MLSELIKLRNTTVLKHALTYTQSQGQPTFSSMTWYEVVRGYRDQSATTQLARFGIFCRQANVMPITDAILDLAAELWVKGRRGGHPHEDADLIIAATALEHGCTLVTGNTAHFSWIPGLTMEDWRRP
jgi:tRNA(fMet)-specific endonuclease VapC